MGKGREAATQNKYSKIEAKHKNMADEIISVRVGALVRVCLCANVHECSRKYAQFKTIYRNVVRQLCAARSPAFATH